MRHACLLAVVLMSAPVAGAPLSEPERRLVASVDEQEAGALALLQKVVEINSGTLNFAGVRQVGSVFRTQLDRLDFQTRWVDGAPFGRAGHLLAERPGRTPDALRVLLIGHLDTVFEPDSPFQRFERLAGDRARGPGITDMKGGDVVMLVALRALRDASLLDQLSVSVFLAGDEESTGEPLALARADLRAAGERADMALGFEDGDGRFEHAVISRRGAEQWTLRVTGKPAHSSLVLKPEVGAGAIYELARVLDGFRHELAGETSATYNPGFAVAGTTVEAVPAEFQGRAFGKDNVVAGQAVVTGDLRTLTPEDGERIRRRMREIAADSLPHTSATIEFEDGYPPMPATDGNRRLLALFDEASRDLGFGPVTAVDPRQAGAADISFVAAKVAMALDALGLRGSGGHTSEETGELSTLPRQAKRVALLLARLAAGRR